MFYNLDNKYDKDFSFSVNKSTLSNFCSRWFFSTNHKGISTLDSAFVSGAVYLYFFYYIQLLDSYHAYYPYYLYTDYIYPPYF